MPNPNIIFQDSVTGIYQDVDRSFYLNDGTPINDFDPNTGAYQESDGTWYTFQGVPLINFDKNTGCYQENDGTWYDSTGNEVLLNSGSYNLLKASGYDVSSNVNTGLSQSVSKNNITTTSASKKIAVKASATPIWLLPTLAVVGIALIGTIVYYTMKKK